MQVSAHDIYVEALGSLLRGRCQCNVGRSYESGEQSEYYRSYVVDVDHPALLHISSCFQVHCILNLRRDVKNILNKAS